LFLLPVKMLLSREYNKLTFCLDFTSVSWVSTLLNWGLDNNNLKLTPCGASKVMYSGAGIEKIVQNDEKSVK